MQQEYLEEVKSNKVAKSREHLEEIQWYYTGICADVAQHQWEPVEGNKNLRKTEEQAEAQLALSQLSQLRAYTRRNCGDWKPDWENENQWKHILFFVWKDIKYTKTNTWASAFLAFPERDVCTEFLEKHRDLIMQAMPLYW